MNSQDEPDGLSTADARAVLAGLGVNTYLDVGPARRPTLRTDRAGLEKLRDKASAHGAFVIAAAIDEALGGLPDGQETAPWS